MAVRRCLFLGLDELFEGRHFDGEVIVLCVRWYLRFKLSYRDLVEMMAERGLTKTGNSSARKALVEAAWTYRHSAGVGTTHQRRQQLLPQRVREIAWKAQSRLCARYRQLAAKGKRNTVVIIAIAREIGALCWAIAREVEPAPIKLQTT